MKRKSVISAAVLALAAGVFAVLKITRKPMRRSGLVKLGEERGFRLIFNFGDGGLTSVFSVFVF